MLFMPCPSDPCHCPMQRRSCVVVALTPHATQGLKVAVIEGHDIGGTCVNRGCVPSKALLAASGRVRDFKNQQHLKSLGIQV